MRYDLTEKLKFQEDPVLVIQGKELTVNSDAETVLKLLDAFQDGGGLAAWNKARELLFSEKDQKKLASLHLKTDDFITVMQTATGMAMGNDPDETTTGE